jgi:hypothetical protein
VIVGQATIELVEGDIAAQRGAGVRDAHRAALAAHGG